MATDSARRLTGHGLRSEGAPFERREGRWSHVHRGIVRSSGTGRALCECGATSGVLDSGNARKAWHREHKAEVRAGLDAGRGRS